MLSVTARAAKKVMDKINVSLRADDPRFNRSIHVVTEDSVIQCDGAFLLTYDNYLFIFMEHHECTFEPLDEVVRYSQYESVKVEQYEDHNNV